MESKTICQKCIEITGGCCTSVNLFIHRTEISPFLERKDTFGLPTDHSLEAWDKNEEIYVYNSSHNQCMFLGSDNLCTIYENRPLVCRMYPFLWKENALNLNEIFIDILCPLAHYRPFKKMYEESNNEKNQQQIENLGTLRFDVDEKNYLNITDIKNSSEILEILYTEKFD